MIRIWDLAEPTGTMLEHPLPVDRPIFLADHPGVVVQSAPHHLALVDPRDRRQLAGPFAIPSEPQMIVRTPDGRRLVASCTNEFLGAWEVPSGRSLWQRRLPAEWVSLDFSPDQRRLAVLGAQGTLRCVDVEDGSEPLPVQNIGLASRRVEWSRDRRWLLTTSQVGLPLWDASTWTLAQGPLGGGESIFTARFTPDSRRVAATFTGSRIAPSSALMWTLPDFGRAGLALSHGDALRDQRFSGDGALVATTGLDRAARLWWTATGTAAGPPMRHSGPVNFATFSPDGETLVSGSSDQTVRLWETATGEALTPALLLPGTVQDAELDGTGRSLAVRVNGWPGWLFEFPLETRSLVELTELACLLTGESPDPDRNLRPVPPADLARRFAVRQRQRPTEFAWPADSFGWHRQRAVLAEKSANWPAAVFHLERLARLRPVDAAVATRLREARAHCVT